MDYAGLLSQKRAEESRFRSGWDPIGSPSGLSRSTLGGNSYLGGGGLMAAESAVSNAGAADIDSETCVNTSERK